VLSDQAFEQKQDSSETNFPLLGWLVSYFYHSKITLNFAFMLRLGYFSQHRTMVYYLFGKYWTTMTSNTTWNFNSLLARITQLQLLTVVLFSRAEGLNSSKGAVASWLVRLPPDRAVRVRALAGTLCCVLGQDTLLSQCLSPPRCIYGYRRT